MWPGSPLMGLGLAMSLSNQDLKEIWWAYNSADSWAGQLDLNADTTRRRGIADLRHGQDCGHGQNKNPIGSDNAKMVNTNNGPTMGRNRLVFPITPS